MLDSVNEAVASELRAAAARKKLTGREVGETLGLPKMWVHRRLSASVEISVSDLVTISRAIGVEPLDVLAQALTDVEAPAAVAGT